MPCFDTRGSALLSPPAVPPDSRRRSFGASSLVAPARPCSPLYLRKRSGESRVQGLPRSAQTVFANARAKIRASQIDDDRARAVSPALVPPPRRNTRHCPEDTRSVHHGLLQPLRAR